MFERWSLKFPITLGVVLIVLLVLLTIGWIMLTISSALGGWQHPAMFWTMLALGTSFLVTVLVGVVMYLTLTVRTINLNQRQTNFIDAVTHELKSPIASLKLYLQTLTRQTVSDEERSAFHQYMMEDVQRLDQLINHLLAAARLERYEQVSRTEVVDLNELLGTLAEDVAEQYHVAPGTVRLELQPCSIQAVSDEAVILFRNIIDNAVKYAGDPPQVAIRLYRDTRNRVVIQVEDNGRGIPAALRRHVFGRFVRVGDELVRDRPGTGLGLYLVRTIAQRWRATVRIRDPMGWRQGTMFEVVLPATMVVESRTQSAVQHSDASR
ncbi:MAG: hypothetical protein KatS3mg110_0309 [Pirellulaceae bacterium]|nr:MAG: hypothetical protein KatS3mg110_0309 [Pirellulaceae bacterium]